ncbi:MerR family transcriptional regulator [Streptomyces sp. NPDC005485]|uniref:MerR family transcriptional regulator n=1 Tax=Streptomyces sp. NPDC005485 TaxID=3155591 RepID=UPI0033A1DEE7
MRIGDAAAAVGVTTRTLRYYEQRGLVTARRTSSGQREYAEEDVRRLRAVRELLESGLTIGDVRLLVDTLDELPDLPGVSPHRTDTGPTTCVFPQGVGPVSQPRVDTPTTCVVPQVAYRRLAELDDRIRRLTELRARLAAQLDAPFAALVGELVPDSTDHSAPEDRDRRGGTAGVCRQADISENRRSGMTADRALSR